MTSVQMSPSRVAALPWLRFGAVAAPLFLLLYGGLRLVDGLDGRYGPGLAWNAGHAMFLVAFVLLGVVTVGLHRLVAETGGARRRVAGAATVAGLAGVGAFLWVILGDLFAPLKEHAPLPDPLYAAGPLLFQLGLLTLLVQLVAVRPRRLPFWSPVLVFLGFVPIAVDLDLLPVGALLLLGGLAPVARLAGAPWRPGTSV